MLCLVVSVVLPGQAAAAFIFRAVGELNDFVELYSYWTFSDVFEEGGLPVRDVLCAPPRHVDSVCISVHLSRDESG